MISKFSKFFCNPWYFRILSICMPVLRHRSLHFDVSKAKYKPLYGYGQKNVILILQKGGNGWFYGLVRYFVKLNM